MCVLKNPNAIETGEDCFEPLTLSNGQRDYEVLTGINEFDTKVKLPDGLKCARCVLRWHYQAGKYFLIPNITVDIDVYC